MGILFSVLVFVLVASVVFCVASSVDIFAEIVDEEDHHGYKKR